MFQSTDNWHMLGKMRLNLFSIWLVPFIIQIILCRLCFCLGLYCDVIRTTYDYVFRAGCDKSEQKKMDVISEHCFHKLNYRQKKHMWKRSVLNHQPLSISMFFVTNRFSSNKECFFRFPFFCRIEMRKVPIIPLTFFSAHLFSSVCSNF